MAVDCGFAYARNITKPINIIQASENVDFLWPLGVNHLVTWAQIEVEFRATVVH